MLTVYWNVDKTHWRTSDILPVHIGVYETTIADKVIYEEFQYWNGKFWGYTATSPSCAEFNKDLKSKFQTPRWRGLLVNPMKESK